ncbi:hypothetical protein O2V63_01470 [Modestobacter sp. VKM Ac-2977]|uniref:hypothetical protein n=1 Tax=Modestobacter sp. VKM Ac-2977 TaxID=3004131 RepID=UPI0022AB4108|nr:hypothetical protein [Modestobacter sp. VKM Ac-2977]MCZ2818997.1 hypothetical protein [Modestobacter sp. VKM Ac-2977]
MPDSPAPRTWGGGIALAVTGRRGSTAAAALPVLAVGCTLGSLGSRWVIRTTDREATA